MDPIELYPGERRFLAVDLVSLIRAGDSLSGTPDLEIVAKRGRTATTMLLSSPEEPAVLGTKVTFWVEVPLTQKRGNYLALVRCPTAEGESIPEEAKILVL